MRAALILLGVLAAAGTPTDAIRQRDAEIRAALPPEGTDLSEADRRRIEGIVSRIVDSRAMLEAAMGLRWAKLSEKQRRRILEAFERRFRATGGSQLETYRGTRIEYLPEKREGEVVNVIADSVRALPEVAAPAGGPEQPAGVRQLGHAGMRRLG